MLMYSNIFLHVTVQSLVISHKVLNKVGILPFPVFKTSTWNWDEKQKSNGASKKLRLSLARGLYAPHKILLSAVPIQEVL